MVTEKEYVIVTGASGRFGSIISKLLAEEGKNLILISRSGNANISHLQKRVDVVDLKISLDDASSYPRKQLNVLNIISTIKQDYNVAGVVYCAGGVPYTSGDWLDRINRNLDVNVKAYLCFIMEFMDDFLRRDKGFFVSCSSIGGYGNNYDLFNFYKFPLITITESIHHRLSIRNSNVKIFCLPICSLVDGGGTKEPIPKEDPIQYAEKLIFHLKETGVVDQPLLLSDECEGSIVGKEIINIQKSMRIITQKEVEHFGWSPDQEKNYFNGSIIDR